MTKDNKKQKKNLDIKSIIILILLILLLFMGAGLYYVYQTGFSDQPVTAVLVEPDTVRIYTSSTHTDTIAIRDTVIRILEKTVIIKDTVCFEEKTKDTLPTNPCANDTTLPWVYPDPSGGLHYGSIAVKLVSTKPAKITWKFKSEKKWHTWLTGQDSILVSKNRVICFKARDTCGNRMDLRCETYEIKARPKRKCSLGMEYIKIGNTSFCIDKYEWPNKKGKKPMSYISLHHAKDSCFISGKRLCSTDEWKLACAGIYSWKYPYGDKYEPKACVTRDTSSFKSGSKPECRGYFEVFDMSGNLAEWTNTKSPKNKSFYNVMGGFWDSGPQGSCFEPRYSYYPQNTHNPVGFRCCKDVKKD